MTDYSDHDLVAKYMEIKAYVEAEQQSFNERMAPSRKGMELIENVFLKRLNERKANNSKTEAGVAYKSTRTDITIVDRMTYLKFCLNNWNKWGSDMMNIGAVTKPVKNFIEESPTKSPPPGLTVGQVTRVNIRKA